MVIEETGVFFQLRTRTKRYLGSDREVGTEDGGKRCVELETITLFDNQ